MSPGYFLTFATPSATSFADISEHIYVQVQMLFPPAPCLFVISVQPLTMLATTSSWYLLPGAFQKLILPKFCEIWGNVLLVST
jgi:hypothetical protein